MQERKGYVKEETEGQGKQRRCKRKSRKCQGEMNQFRKNEGAVKTEKRWRKQKDRKRRGRGKGWGEKK